MGNAKTLKNHIVQWIMDYFEDNGKDCYAVVGISGGKDSSVVAALCAEALGKDRVVGVLMPNDKQSDIEDSYRLVEALGIKSVEINVGDAYSMMLSEGSHELPISKQAEVNLAPRLRMAALYMVAQSLEHGGRVANTCNYSEDYVGYSTKYGDSAGDFSPLSGLFVSEVVAVGHELPIPADLVDKTPSDGLCGKSDESNLGFTYAQLEKYIVDGSCGDREIDKKICNLHYKNLHKITPMPYFKKQLPLEGF